MSYILTQETSEILETRRRPKHYDELQRDKKEIRNIQEHREFMQSRIRFTVELSTVRETFGLLPGQEPPRKPFHRRMIQFLVGEQEWSRL